MGYFESDPWYDVIERQENAERHVPVFRQKPGDNLLNTIDIRAPAMILEFEQFCFHHGSAVTLPCLPSVSEGTQDEAVYEDDDLMRPTRDSHPDSYTSFVEAHIGDFDDDAHHRRALILLAVTYRFLRNTPAYRLVISGHTDSTGSDSFNFSLSDKRAENVLALFTGDSDGWVRISEAMSKTEDVQRILKHYAHVNYWDCDPGPVDDINGQVTSNAIRKFQTLYNETFKANITVDGIVGTQTWGAIFDTYMDELARLMKITVSDLPSERAHLRYIKDDHKTIGCGERVPIDGTYQDNYRSQEDRRVELLFFHEHGLPDLSAHAPGGVMRHASATPEQSTIYSPELHTFAFLDPVWWSADPPNRSYDPRFEVKDSKVERELNDDPDSSESDTSHPVTQPVDDPWDFLDHFDDHHPGYGGASEVERET